jgi:hypothetical protein
VTPVGWEKVGHGRRLVGGEEKGGFSGSKNSRDDEGSRARERSERESEREGKMIRRKEGRGAGRRLVDRPPTTQAPMSHFLSGSDMTVNCGGVEW